MVKGLLSVFGAAATLSFSSLSFAQDMSGWSDNTICRLVKQHNDNSAYVVEAEVRKIKCSNGISVSLKPKSKFKLREVPKMVRSSTLRNLKVPEGGIDFIDDEKLLKFLRTYNSEVRVLSFCSVLSLMNFNGWNNLCRIGFMPTSSKSAL